MQAIAAISLRDCPRDSSCSVRSSCSLRIVWMLEMTSPRERKTRVAPIRRNPSLRSVLPSQPCSVATTKALESLRELHPVADEAILVVGSRDEPADLELLEHGRILQRVESRLD